MLKILIELIYEDKIYNIESGHFGHFTFKAIYRR